MQMGTHMYACICLISFQFREYIQNVDGLVCVRASIVVDISIIFIYIFIKIYQNKYNI